MHPYVLRGRLYCGYCGRRMQGQYSNQAPYYRCRYPREYALASHVRHPGNVYLREADVLPAIDRWLLVIFAPHRLEQTIREMQAAQDPCPAGLRPPGQDTEALIASCDARLARYQAALDAGADPKPSPSGPVRSRPSARPCSPAPPAGTATSLPASSPRTTSALSSPASAICATSSTMPSHR